MPKLHTLRHARSHVASIQGAFALNIIVLVFVSILLALLCLLIYFLRGRNRIINHPNVEPIHIAHPAIAEEVQVMVERIASIAEVAIPEVFIFRAESPNAFVIPSRRKPLLLLADELFEECNELGAEKGLPKLEWTICHEIAHLSERHGISSAITELLDLVGQSLKISALRRIAQTRRDAIENQANARADIIHKSLSA